MKSNVVVIEPPRTDSRVFAHTRLDVIPILAAVCHCVYFFGMFYLFTRVPLWVMLILGFIYSVSISWNINGVSHNFIHNPYFRSPLLNRLFSVLESVTVGFSQVFYDCIHCSITRETPIDPTNRARQSIGFQFTNTATTARRSIR
jgi:fatty acid desaturase